MLAGGARAGVGRRCTQTRERGWMASSCVLPASCCARSVSGKRCTTAADAAVTCCFPRLHCCHHTGGAGSAHRLRC